MGLCQSIRANQITCIEIWANQLQVKLHWIQPIKKQMMIANTCFWKWFQFVWFGIFGSKLFYLAQIAIASIAQLVITSDFQPKVVGSIPAGGLFARFFNVDLAPMWNYFTWIWPRCEIISHWFGPDVKLFHIAVTSRDLCLLPNLLAKFVAHILNFADLVLFCQNS